MSSLRDMLTQAWPVLPVLVIDEPQLAVPLAAALYEGGLTVVEVTLRTPAALQAVEAIRRQLPELAVGVGTVVDGEQLQAAQSAGAEFVVSPGFTPALAATAQQAAIPWLPGVMTAGEIMQARELGYRELKLFPAQGAAGLSLLDSYAGPFTDVMFCPTGGISADNLPAFLQRRNVICCGGSWLAPAALVQQQNWAAISQLARDAVQAAHDMRNE